MKNLTFIVLSALALAGCEPEAYLVLSPDGDVPADRAVEPDGGLAA